jgi:hypothetical protein
MMSFFSRKFLEWNFHWIISLSSSSSSEEKILTRFVIKRFCVIQLSIKKLKSQFLHLAVMYRMRYLIYPSLRTDQERFLKSRLGNSNLAAICRDSMIAASIPFIKQVQTAINIHSIETADSCIAIRELGKREEEEEEEN